MQSKVKLSKRQIKEDKFTTFMLTSKQQLSDNWQFLVIGIVIVALVIFGIAYYFNSQGDWQAEGSEAFARAVMQYRNGDLQVALSSFEQILEDYGSHEVAEPAAFLLGRTYFQMNNWSEAIAAWENYLAKYKKNPMNRAAALAGIGAVNENQGTYATAAQKYIEAVEEFPEGPLVAEYRYGGMRAYLADGQEDQAREQLELIEEAAPENSEIYRRAARYFASKVYTGQSTP